MNCRWMRMMAAGCLAASACGPRPGPVVAPYDPPGAPPATRPAPPMHAEGYRDSICVVRNGRMAMVPVHYDPVTGDTTVDGRPFREVYPVTAEYASSAAWNAGSEPIVYRGLWYRRTALPRVLRPRDVVPVDVYQGVAVFAKPDTGRALPEVIWFPVDPRCRFQPYEISGVAGAVRG